MIKKILSIGKKNTGGRNRGLISTKRRSALVKKKYCFLDYKRIVCENQNLEIILPEISDANRSAKTSLIKTPAGEFAYILAPNYIKNQKFIMNNTVPKNLKESGYSAKLKYIPLGTVLHNVELLPAMGGQIARSAGTSAILLKIVEKKALMKFKSGEHRYIPNENMATLGVVGNHEHFLHKMKKAGDRRLQGFRPRVRPSVMNPVDHPMGGRTKGGCAPKSATGKLSHGPSTMKKKAHKLTLICSRKIR